MNIIQEITTNYKPYYNEDGKKVVTGPAGKLFFDDKETIINVNGSLITLYATTGAERATRSVDPIRIILFLKKECGIELNVYPKTKLKRFVELFIPGKSIKVPNKIRNQFSFNGNNELIDKLILDRLFVENIFSEKVYIVIDKKTSQNILLTPAKGISSLEQFDKFIRILRLIESKIMNK